MDKNDMTSVRNMLDTRFTYTAIKLAEGDQEGTTWLHLFTEGTYLEGTFLEFTLNEQTFQDMIEIHGENAERPRRASIMLDYNHKGLSGGRQDGAAAGWLLDGADSLEMRQSNQGLELWGCYKLNRAARESLNEDEWRYMSPEFTERREINGQVIRASLLATALTNRPLTDLEAVQLSQERLRMLSGVQEEDVHTATNIEEDTMAELTAEALQEAIATAMEPVTKRLNALENPDSIKVYSQAEGDALKTRAEEAEKKLNKMVEETITTKLSGHVDRGAITAAQMEASKKLIMASDDYTVALNEQNDLFAAIPDNKEKSTTTETTDTGNGTITNVQGADEEVIQLSVKQFVDKQVKEGSSLVEARRMAYQEFKFEDCEKEFSEAVDEDEGVQVVV